MWLLKMTVIRHDFGYAIPDDGNPVTFGPDAGGEGTTHPQFESDGGF